MDCNALPIHLQNEGNILGHGQSDENISKFDAIYSLCEAINSVVIPIWLFPLFWSITIAERIKYVSPASDICGLCFQVLGKFKDGGFNISASLDNLNAISSELQPKILQSGMALDIEKKRLTLLLGEHEMNVRIFFPFIDLNKGSHPVRRDKIVGTDSVDLFKQIQQYLIPEIKKKIEALDVDYWKETTDEKRTKVINELYSIGKILLNMISSTLLNARKKCRTTGHKISQIHGHQDFNAVDLEQKNENTPQLTEGNSMHTLDKHKAIQSHSIATTEIEGRTPNTSDHVLDNGSIISLTIDDIFPQEERNGLLLGRTQRSDFATKSFRYSVKNRDHARRVTPLWIIPLIVEYLTIPEFRNNLPPMSILRRCEAFTPINERYNEAKVSAGFKFAESCLTIRFWEVYDHFNESEHLKEAWMKDI